MITILGAGMGGLTLARILHINVIPCEVLDAEISATPRHQAGPNNTQNAGVDAKHVSVTATLLLVKI